MVVVDDAAIGSDGRVRARLTEALVASLGHFNGGRGLAASDVLGLASEADGTAPDANFHEVGAALARKRKPSASTTLPAPIFTVSP